MVERITDERIDAALDFLRQERGLVEHATALAAALKTAPDFEAQKALVIESLVEAYELAERFPANMDCVTNTDYASMQTEVAYMVQARSHFAVKVGLTPGMIGEEVTEEMQRRIAQNKAIKSDAKGAYMQRTAKGGIKRAVPEPTAIDDAIATNAARIKSGEKVEPPAGLPPGTQVTVFSMGPKGMQQEHRVAGARGA